MFFSTIFNKDENYKEHLILLSRNYSNSYFKKKCK